ncbi:MAG: potassium channel protein [Saprospiraceae bacterium]|nr:potassium channel protein [Saprospiraceae bacterium]
MSVKHRIGRFFDDVFERIFVRALLRYAILLMIIILVVGILGYMIIEKDSFFDALYMTIITVSTVGFREIHEFSDGGRVFTIFLITTSWFTLAYAISIITKYFVEGQIHQVFRKYRNNIEMKRKDNHVIVVGYGRNGQQAVKGLLAHKQPFVIIETNHEIITNNQTNDINFWEGDATEDETLIAAGINRAKAVVSTLPIDADNLFVVLTARALNRSLNIISRASNKASERKLRTAGANHVVMPEKVGGEHMASLVLKPDVVEFLDNISFQGEAKTNLEEIICSNLPESMINNTIYDLGIRKKTGANIVGFKTPDGEYIINPTPDTKMLPNTKLFVLGTPEQINLMKEIFINGKSECETK